MSKFFIFSFLIAFFLAINPAEAQKVGKKPNNLKGKKDSVLDKPDSVLVVEGIINIKQDHRIDRLLEKHTNYNKDHPEIKGYRVQIYSGTQKAEALRKKGIFLSMFPDEKADVIYDTPYFKLRVGNYRLIWKAKKRQKEKKDEPR